MKIFTGDHIREADLYTIGKEPVSSLELMERAAEELAARICQVAGEDKHIKVVAGKGNNGGDGLAIARILSNAGIKCSVYIPFPETDMSPDCRSNYNDLPQSVSIDGVLTCEGAEGRDVVIIDALFGTGLSGDADIKCAEIIREINRAGECGCSIISVDIPSGMKMEFDNVPENIVKADITLTIQFPKLAMLLPEAGQCCGEIEIVDIGLHPDFLRNTPPRYFLSEKKDIIGLFPARGKFSHKGNYGHCLLICGSKGMMGACILSTCAALRSGCGLVTAHVPEAYSLSIYTSAPSALVSTDSGICFSTLPLEPERYDVIGIGCGIGREESTVKALERLLRLYRKPMVIDADALNIISSEPELFDLIPENSILTPHPGEFGRIVGQWDSERDKICRLRELTSRIKGTVVLKGAYTMVCMRDGNIYINPTGTPAMAKGGSGDVLTGLITGLCARGLEPEDAARAGVYLHGLAGEKAAGYYGREAVNSSDIIEFIGEAFEETI